MLWVVIGFVIWVPIWFLAMSLAEWTIHRYFEHRKTWPLGWIYQEHAVEHHGQGKNEVPRNIDTPLWTHLIVASPALGAHLFSWLVLGRSVALGGLLAGISVLWVHAWTWTALHRLYHRVGGEWALNLPFAKAVLRHHELHHQNDRTNFCVLFGVGWLDRLLKTDYSSKSMRG